MTDTVVVYCDAPSHKRGKVAKCGTYTRHAGLWSLTYNPTAQQLRGDQPITGETFGETRKNRSEVRSRHSVRCKLCDDSVSVVTPKLTRILDGLAESGVERVSIAGLRACVESVTSG